MRILAVALLLVGGCDGPASPIDPRTPRAGEYELTVSGSDAGKGVTPYSGKSGSKVCITESDRGDLKKLLFGSNLPSCKKSEMALSDGVIRGQFKCSTDAGDLSNAAGDISGHYQSDGWSFSTSTTSPMTGQTSEEVRYHRVGDC